MFETKIVSSYEIADRVRPKDHDALAASIDDTLNDISEREGRVIEQRVIKAPVPGGTGGKIESVDSILYVAQFSPDTRGYDYHVTLVSPRSPQSYKQSFSSYGSFGRDKTLDEYAAEVNQAYTNAAEKLGRIAFFNTVTLDSPPNKASYSLLVAELPR
jgi:hypothetical protein